MVVLIVDDDEGIAQAVCDILESEGYAAVIAATPRTAATEAIAVGADIVLLDLIMPGFSGWDVAAALRANPLTARIPIVLMSAREHVREAAEAIGTPFWFRKPFNIADLSRAVAGALASSPEETVA